MDFKKIFLVPVISLKFQNMSDQWYFQGPE